MGKGTEAAQTRTTLHLQRESREGFNMREGYAIDRRPRHNAEYWALASCNLSMTSLTYSAHCGYRHKTARQLSMRKASGPFLRALFLTRAAVAIESGHTKDVHRLGKQVKYLPY
jgi:hypothetical protein